MLYPYQNHLVSTSENTVALDANVQAVVNAINTNAVIPYGEYGGPTVYYFQTILLNQESGLLKDTSSSQVFQKLSCSNLC